jgi:hypothetical protein
MKGVGLTLRRPAPFVFVKPACVPTSWRDLALTPTALMRGALPHDQRRSPFGYGAARAISNHDAK